MISPATKMPARFVDEFLQKADGHSARHTRSTVHQRLRNEVVESLRATGYFVTVPCEITVQVDREGRVSLGGTVPTYYLKQKAQAAAISVDGVNSLRNDLVVSQ